ncbi:MAG: DUF262 domain-containing protein [bacterium]
METPPRLPKRPEVRSEKVEDLVERVHRGRIRVPWFQRAWKWERSDVQELFDSVYRGYPIGSLLFYRRQAPADRLRLGPLVIDAAEEADAWWVVDGQQRLTTFTVCLKRPVPLPAKPEPDDPFVLYFDVQEQSFRLPPRTGTPPTTWVPLPTLLDASELTEWAFGWEHGRDEALRRVLFEAGARIREYSVPLYLVEAEPQAARQIFVRTNKTGKSLDWTTVHKALFGQEETRPSTLTDLREELAGVGMGDLSEERLLTALVSLRGLDPTRTLDEHYRRDPEALRDAVQEALPILRRVLSFLRQDAAIVHLRLLPKRVLVDVLARFFALHPTPSARSRALLCRWFWRTVLGACVLEDRTLRRRGIRAIGDDEEASVQGLLTLVDRTRRRPFELPQAFDGRSDDNRIVLCALGNLEPRHLETAQPLDVAALIEEQGKEAFARIVKRSDVAGSRGPANRILQPKGLQVMRLLKAQKPSLLNSVEIPSTHAISPEALDRLSREDLPGFLAVRAETLTAVVRRFGDRMAAWEHSDRPSVDYLLQRAGAAAS